MQPEISPSDALVLSQALVGRDAAKRQLLDAFEQTSQGHGQIVLLPGLSGTGKTSLARAIRSFVRERNGFFIEGKSNQYQQGVPNAALRGALVELCHEIQSGSQAQLARWQTSTTQAVGSLGGLLMGLAPELGFLLDIPAGASEISPAEARHRFASVTRAFLGATCQPEHPVVLFLDDLQWADPALLELLTRLEVGTALRYLLVICSYRSDEVDADHPLSATLRSLREQDVALVEISVANLDKSDLAAMLENALSPAADDIAGLATLVFERTLGNPFFVRSLLGFLYDRQWLRFDAHRQRWSWRLSSTLATHGAASPLATLPHDIVELFSRRLQSLPEDGQQLLSLAACAGVRFDTQELAKILDWSESRCQALLKQALAHRLIAALDPDEDRGDKNTSARWFVFCHDRVQQAAYALAGPARLSAASAYWTYAQCRTQPSAARFANLRSRRPPQRL